MNTTGIQNYLSNVFRPIVSYTDSNFAVKMELSNIDTYSGNVVSVIRADVGDSVSNVYVGTLSGNSIVSTQSCSQVSAFGYAAGRGISNCSTSVYLGTQAGETSSNNQGVISIGYQSGQAGTGVSNIFVGTGTRAGTGSSNILLGHGIVLSNTSNQVRIGYGTKIPIAADLSRNWVGIGGITSPIVPNGTTMDVSGITRSTGGYVSIQSNISAGIGATVNVGTIKKGIFHISAVDQSSSANRAATTYFAWTLSNVTSMSATSNGDTSITTSSTNIQISNATTTKTYDYTITYFPLP